MNNDLITEFQHAEKEPILRFIVRRGISPFRAGLYFFILFSIPLTIWGLFSKGVDIDNQFAESHLTFFLSYRQNISWWIPVIFLLPTIIGLSMHYYYQIPKLLSHISKDLKKDRKLEEFNIWVIKRSTTWIVPLIIFILNLLLNSCYYFQLTTKTNGMSWITNGTLFHKLFGTDYGLSYVGLFSSIIQFLMIYWIINFVWRSLVFSFGLYRFFNKFQFSIYIDPIHQDGCCGLKKIGDIAMIFNWILFLLGILLSLKVIDNIIVKNISLNYDIGIPAFLVAYITLTPIIFFLPLASAHKLMKINKENFLCDLHNKIRSSTNKFIESDKLSGITELKDLDIFYNNLKRKISVWPFNFKSLESFFGTIIVPILPVVLPFLIKYLIQFFSL